VKGIALDELAAQSKFESVKCPMSQNTTYLPKVSSAMIFSDLSVEQGSNSENGKVKHHAMHPQKEAQKRGNNLNAESLLSAGKQVDTSGSPNIGMNLVIQATLS